MGEKIGGPIFREEKNQIIINRVDFRIHLSKSHIHKGTMSTENCIPLEFPSEFEGDELPISANGLDVLKRRYLRKSSNGDPGESVKRMFWRVASSISAESGESDADDWAKKYYKLMTTLKFLPNSPTFMGAGTPLGQLAACFVLPISDDMGKLDDGIFRTLKNAALVQQTGGGIGFSFSRLRPKNDLVNTSMGRASGPVSFLKIYDTAFGAIAQGGSRRGASMAVLRVDHPDIEEFITCKTTEGSIRNFNISVGLTDDFMRAVNNGADFSLVNPRTKEVVKTLPAKKLFRTIVTQAHHNGEPGVVFLDTANRTNSVPELYEFESTNPCGEQFLGPYENCCLGSVNLAMHVSETDGKAGIDWKKLEETVRFSTQFLDDVVTANKYVPAVPQLKDAAHKVRRIGLGIMGLADMLLKLRVRYGSPKCVDLAGQVMEFVRFHAMYTSMDLVKTDGRKPFPTIKQSVFNPGNFTWKSPNTRNSVEHDFGRPELDWEELTMQIKKHGIRNGAHTTIAPTGTIGTVVGCEGYGCEPAFALAYTRVVKETGGDVKLNYVSPIFLAELAKEDITSEDRDCIIEEVKRHGSCQKCEKLPQKLRDTFVVSQDLTADDHVAVQAALQRFVDNSISKTINFPAHATVEDVEKAYITGWKSGCKGMTIYVTGSRDKVVLETQSTADMKKNPDKDKSQLHAPFSKKRPRPDQLTGITYRRDTPLGKAYVTINHTEDEEPLEVFLNVGKTGTDIATLAEAMGRLISLALRLPSPQTPTERMIQIADQLKSIGGVRTTGIGPTKVLSLPDGVASALNTDISRSYKSNDDSEPCSPAVKTTGRSFKNLFDLCPDCGHATFVHIEGCKKCGDCGYGEC